MPFGTGGPAIDLIEGALLVGVVSFLLLMLAWNRGQSTIVNLEAQDEPAVAAAGIAIAYVAIGWAFVQGLLPPSIGLLLLAIGTVVAISAAVARYTGLLDYSEVV